MGIFVMGIFVMGVERKNTKRNCSLGITCSIKLRCLYGPLIDNLGLLSKYLAIFAKDIQ
jgi:hypothetical protein